MAVEYGTIAVVPMGTWENSKDYDVGNLVELDGSSYVAKVKPPAGMLPTDTAYWQISAKGASKATVDIAGVVKPDGVTTEVDANASLSVKKATQSTVGIVKGSDDIKVGADGSIDVDTTFTQATELANIIAGEAIASVLGKVSKAIAITMSLDQNALLKNMLTSIDGNSSEKVPTQAYIHTLVERIGMGTELTAGANLTEVANKLSSNLASKITVMTYSKSNIPIVAGNDFFANIPVDIDTSAYRWVFPILSDITGDNSTKINISTCIWQNGQVHIKGNNQATGTANISLSGIVIAIK